MCEILKNQYKCTKQKLKALNEMVLGIYLNSEYISNWNIPQLCRVPCALDFLGCGKTKPEKYYASRKIGKYLNFAAFHLMVVEVFSQLLAGRARCGAPCVRVQPHPMPGTPPQARRPATMKIPQLPSNLMVVEVFDGS